MNSLITPFVGKAERTARENLREFVAAAQRDAFFVGSQALTWTASSWDFTPFFIKVGPGATKAHFTNLETSRRGARSRNAVEFEQPFQDAAKAIMVVYLRTTGAMGVSSLIMTLRVLEKAYRVEGLVPDICNLTPDVLDQAEQICKENYASPELLTSLLERVVNNVINPARLVPISLFWKTSVRAKRGNHSYHVNMNGGASGNTEKLPHLKSILDLAGVFHTSSDVRDQITTSWFVFALFAPSRANEILSLPVDCGTEMDGVFGISWRSLKGGPPKTNFAVTDEWASLTRKAIERLLKLGERPRTAAKWYEDNPGQLYLPPGFEHLRGKPITLWEASEIIGTTQPHTRGNGPRKLLKRVGKIRDITREGPAGIGRPIMLFSFESLEAYVLARLPKGWPFIDKRIRLKASEALFCMPSNILAGGASTEWNIPMFLKYGQIAGELGNQATRKSIFERHSLLDDRTGKAWTMRTHQPRHLLNTLAQSKHISQELIAFWSGRKSVSQNGWYNHLSQEFYIEEWLALDNSSSKPLHVVGPLNDKIVERSRREMISRDDAVRLELGSIVTTRFGLCRHDYSLAMCPMDKDCISCGENSFLKGNRNHLDEARAQLVLETKAASEAGKAVVEGFYGAEKWRDRHEQKAARWQHAIEEMTNPANPDGSIITLPPAKHRQTKAGLAIAVRDTEKPFMSALAAVDVELAATDYVWSEDEDF